jgi:hypothetical protein
MKKLRSDSVWHSLSPEQKEKLEGWLFEECLSYTDALERAQKEFGVTASAPALSRFYRRLAEERKSSLLQGALSWVAKTPDSMDERLLTEEAAFKMLAITAYEISLAGADNIQLKELRRIMKLILQRRSQAMRRRGWPWTRNASKGSPKWRMGRNCGKMPRPRKRLRRKNCPRRMTCAPFMNWLRWQKARHHQEKINAN